MYDSNGNKIAQTEWDEDLGGPAYLTKEAGELIEGYPNCGEWRYKGVDNDMDFYITPGCNLEIRKRDAVLSNVRMEWTLDEFYADGGTTSFADRVAAALGVHRSQVKVVAVYYGSVNVEYLITALPDEEYYEEAELTAGLTDEEIEELNIYELVYVMEAELSELLTNNAVDFGATVISADVAGSVDLVAVTDTSAFTSGAGAGASSNTGNGFSATEAIASFALLMAPTVMVLARDNEIVELLGDLYNSATDADEVNTEEEPELVIPEDHGDENIFMRTFGHPFNFMKK